MVSPAISPRYTAVVRAIAKSFETFSRVGDCLLLDVFSDDVGWLAKSDDPKHFGPKVFGDPSSSRSSAKGLAREASTHEIGADDRHLSDVVVAGDVRPVLSENRPAPGIDLAECDGSHPGSFEPEGEAADSAEKVEDIHRFR